MGLPVWPVIAAWLVLTAPALLPFPFPISALALKNPEVTQLDDYGMPPPAAFWSSIPRRLLTTAAVSPVNGPALMACVDALTGITDAQRAHARLVVQELIFGASACQNTPPLPALMEPNTLAAVEHGSFVTDNIVSWLKAGFCAGPFLAPPVPGFRCNSILAVPQPGKVCVILNLSSPDGQSFNDNINDNLLESVVMSTTCQVEYTIVDCGVGARIWKYDLRDAYKNFPEQTADFRLQGFPWLGKFFVEMQLIFGARNSVPVFDRLGDILVVIAIALSGIARRFDHRTLDDAPIVTPASSSAGPTPTFLLSKKIYQVLDSGQCSFLDSPPSGTVIAGRARLFYTRLTCLSCEIIGALLIAILFWVCGIRA